MSVTTPVATLLSVRDLPSRALCRAYEVLPAVGGCHVPGVVESVMVVELGLGLARDLAEDAYVRVAHGRAPPRSEIGIATATARGSEWGMSPSSTSLNPSVPRRAKARRASPHSGQAPRSAAVAGVRRSLQFGQPGWVMARVIAGSFRVGRARTRGRPGS